jgi:PhzF family phenazine biosynthesis protein
MTQVLRYAAFTRDPRGGNPAGVVLDASGLSAGDMQRIAAEVGYSETAFLTPLASASQPQRHAQGCRRNGGAQPCVCPPVPAARVGVQTQGGGTAGGEQDVRYVSPRAEVSFCGHATIALAVAHAERHGPGRLRLRTAAGRVDVVSHLRDGVLTATLTSVTPSVAEARAEDVDEALAALRWRRADLDPALPPRVAYAGAHHLVLAVHDRAVLSGLDYSFDRLGALMASRGWTTLQLVHRRGPTSFDARNPFPPGGVVEDPATGAAAAALGAYLRALRLVRPPATVVVRQGHDMGRPSTLHVDVPAGVDAPVRVGGTAVAMPAG